MIYTEKSCKKFIEAAASKEPVPGGGSVAALAGAKELPGHIMVVL